MGALLLRSSKKKQKKNNMCYSPFIVHTDIINYTDAAGIQIT